MSNYLEGTWNKFIGVGNVGFGSNNKVTGANNIVRG
jgi:hypothetical protein